MGKVAAAVTDTVSKALRSFLNVDPLGNQSHIKEEKAVDHPECGETHLQSLGRSACLAIVVLLSCLPLVKTTSLTTPCWDHVIVLPQVSVIPWTWRQPQKQEEQGQDSEAQGKGCVGSEARHLGWALQEGVKIRVTRRPGWIPPSGGTVGGLMVPEAKACVSLVL